jgi:hypothetical protein
MSGTTGQGILPGLSNGPQQLEQKKEHILPQHYEIIQVAILNQQESTCFTEGVLKI